jgi:hypothetical protein
VRIKSHSSLSFASKQRTSETWIAFLRELSR